MSSPSYQTNLDEVRRICEEFVNQHPNLLGIELLDEFRLFLRKLFNITLDSYQFSIASPLYRQEHRFRLLIVSIAYLFEDHFRLVNRAVIDHFFAMLAEKIIIEVLNVSEE